MSIQIFSPLTANKNSSKVITAAEESSSPPRGKQEEGRRRGERDGGGGGNVETVGFLFSRLIQLQMNRRVEEVTGLRSEISDGGKIYGLHHNCSNKTTKSSECFVKVCNVLKYPKESLVSLLQETLLSPLHSPGKDTEKKERRM